jgi:hypothetical protein
MKLTQKKCRIKLPKIKSANALLKYVSLQSMTAVEGCGGSDYLSWDMCSNSALFSVFVCSLKLAVSTNCPTVAPKPERNALNGYKKFPCQ